MRDHCYNSTDGQCADDGSVCRCDCHRCQTGRRDPEDVLEDALRVLGGASREPVDELELFREVTESLAAVVRLEEARQLEAMERVDVQVRR